MPKTLRFLAAALFLTLGVVAMAKPAAAYFEVCNRSSQDVSVAFGYPHDGDWVSEGWWNLAPGDCSTVYSFDLKAQTYYVYVEGEAGSIEGDYVFCGIDAEFTIVGDYDCKARGYEPYGFVEVNVGEALDFSYDVTD